jgi:glyoxylase-like metal-dependent hydrolase (beta-lactamase superfamily II)
MSVATRVRIEHVEGGVQRLALGRVNAYLVPGPQDGWVLVDCGLPAHAPAIERAVRRLGGDPRRLRRILLTHRHLDHAGSAAALSRLSGAPVHVHHADAAAVQGRERLSPTIGTVTGRLVGGLVSLSDRYVFRYDPCQARPEGDGFEVDGLRLVHLPGHTPGHSGYLHLESGVLLAGDAASNSRGRLRRPSHLFSLDPGQVGRSLERLAGLRAAVYCFGHGRPLRDGADGLLGLARAGSSGDGG